MAWLSGILKAMQRMERSQADSSVQALEVWEVMLGFQAIQARKKKRPCH